MNTRISRTSPVAPSAEAVDPTTSATQARVGAHDWASATTTSAAMPQRWGTKSDGSASGAANGLASRSTSDGAIAYTKPSSGLWSRRFHTPAGDTGGCSSRS